MKRRDDSGVRLACLTRDRLCQRCATSNPGRLEVHHILPIAQGGPDTLDNVTLLCGDCHSEWHRSFEGGMPFGEWLTFPPPRAIRRALGNHPDMTMGEFLSLWRTLRESVLLMESEWRDRFICCKMMGDGTRQKVTPVSDEESARAWCRAESIKSWGIYTFSTMEASPAEFWVAGRHFASAEELDAA